MLVYPANSRSYAASHPSVARSWSSFDKERTRSGINEYLGVE